MDCRPSSELDTILRDLWSLPQREFQYVAVGLLGKFEKQLPANFIKTIEYMMVTKSWWDTVDTISGGTVGVHFQEISRDPRKVSRQMARLR